MREKAAALRGQVAYYQRLGLDHEGAVQAAATSNQLGPQTVAWLLVSYPEPISERGA
jgi:hypothetical protein